MNFFNPLGTRLNWLEAMGIDRFHNRGLLSVALCQETPSCLTRLESGAHYPQEYGRVFNSFKRKRLKCVLLVHFNINQNRVRLKRLVPNLRLRLSVFPLVVRVLLRLSTACHPQSPATHKTRFTHTARTQYTHTVRTLYAHSTHTVRTLYAHSTYTARNNYKVIYFLFTLTSLQDVDQNKNKKEKQDPREHNNVSQEDSI